MSGFYIFDYFKIAITCIVIKGIIRHLLSVSWITTTMLDPVIPHPVQNSENLTRICCYK